MSALNTKPLLLLLLLTLASVAEAQTRYVYPGGTPTTVKRVYAYPGGTPVLNYMDPGEIAWGALGDSDSDAFRGTDNRGGGTANEANVFSLVEVLINGKSFDFGVFGSYAEPRRTDYANNWARSGNVIADVLADLSGLLAQVTAGDVTHVYFQGPSNDFGAHATEIYNASAGWTGTALQTRIDDFLADADNIVEQLLDAGAEGVAILDLLDIMEDPYYHTTYPNATFRQRNTDAVGQVNTGLRTMASTKNAERGATRVVVADRGINITTYQDADPRYDTVSGVQIDRANGDSSPNAYFTSANHINTIESALALEDWLTQINALPGLSGYVPFTASEAVTLGGGTPGGGDVTAPLAPTSFVATAGVEQVVLTWTDPTAFDLDAVLIERSTTSGSGFAQVQSVAAGVQTWTDTGVTGGTPYYYRSRAADAVPNYSGYTAESSDTPTVGGTIYVNSTFDGASGANLTGYTGAEGETWADLFSAIGGTSLVQTGTGYARVNANATAMDMASAAPTVRDTWLYVEGDQLTAVNRLGLSFRSPASIVTVPDDIDFYAAYHDANNNTLRTEIFTNGTPSDLNVTAVAETAADGTFGIWVNDKGTSIDIYWEAEGARTLVYTIATPSYGTQYSVGLFAEGDGAVGSNSTGLHAARVIYGDYDFDPSGL